MPEMFEGTWYNQHTSEMILKVDSATNTVTGTYKTGVGSPSPSEPFPLTGFVADDLIAFSVNFGKYRSVTSWAGQLTGDKNGDRLDTLWHLARNIPDQQEKDDLWGAIWTGCDIFRRTPYGDAVATPAGTRPRPSHPLKRSKSR